MNAFAYMKVEAGVIVLAGALFGALGVGVALIWCGLLQVWLLRRAAAAAPTAAPNIPAAVTMSTEQLGIVAQLAAGIVMRAAPAAATVPHPTEPRH